MNILQHNRIKINIDNLDNLYNLDYSNIPHHEDFKTGDLLLFSGKDCFPSKFIEDLTDSKYSHIGIILRNPILDGKEYKGLFIFESTAWIDAKDVEDHKFTTGVQINELSKVYNEPDGNIYWRRLNADRDDNFYKILKNVHSVTYGKDYDFDPMDWIKAYFDIIDSSDQRTDKFICSALVAYTYDQLNFLVKPVDWTIVRPKDFGTEDPPDERRITTINCTLDKEIQIKLTINQSGIGYYMSYVYTPMNVIKSIFKSIQTRFYE